MSKKKLKISKKDLKVNKKEGSVTISNPEFTKLINDESVDETNVGSQGVFLVTT